MAAFSLVSYTPSLQDLGSAIIYNIGKINYFFLILKSILNLLQHWRRQREPRYLWPSTPQRGCPTSTSTTRKSLTARSYRMGWWRNDFWFRSYISINIFHNIIHYIYHQKLDGCNTFNLGLHRRSKEHKFVTLKVYNEVAIELCMACLKFIKKTQKPTEEILFRYFQHLLTKPMAHPQGVWKVCWSSLWSWKATCSLVSQWSSVTLTQRWVCYALIHKV